jgi:branched-chain amino acid transport system permease protein
MAAVTIRRITPDQIGIAGLGVIALVLGLRALLANPDLFFAAVIIGVTNGAFIALIALGYTLVYGIIELINFAHGDLFMLGTFASLQTLIWLGFGTEVGLGGTPWLGIVLAILVAMAFCATLNVLAERVAYRPLRRAPRLAPLISAIGVSFIFINLGLLWFGAAPQRYPDLLPDFDLWTAFTGQVSLVSVRVKDLFVVGLAIPLMLALAWIIKNTKIGKAMRAVAQDQEMALQMGIDVDRVIAFTFLVGGALAGAAAVMYGLYNNNTDFTAGFNAGLKAFTAAVLGGIGNVTGAALGGFALGLLAAFTTIYVGGQWENVGVFSLLVVILVFKPTGLLGERTPER